MSLEVQRKVEPPKSPKLFRTQRELSKAKAEESKIIGEIPPWVKGTFLTTGPGKFDFDKDFAVEHLLDGYALISKFEIGNGKVRFEKKFLESDAYKKALVAQKPVIGEFGTKPSSDPTKSFFSKMIPTLIPELSDNGNISLFNIGNDIFTTGETCFFRELDPETLETGDKFDTNKFFGLQVCSAHPLTDDDGYTYNVGCSILTGLKYNVVKIPPIEKGMKPKDAFKKAKILCTIPTSNTGLVGFMHSFGMTKKYICLIEQPFVINASKILGSVLAKTTSISNWLEWRGDLENRFFIIEKDTGKVLKAEVVSDLPFFFLHIINCYEINDHIVIDLTSFPNANALTHHMNLSKLRRLSLDNIGQDNPCGERYVIPLVDLEDCEEEVNLVTIKTDAIAVRRGKQLVLTSEVVTEKGIELPTINKRFLAKKSSFYYGTGSSTKGFFENAVSKVHASSKSVTIWRESKHYFLGEPIFVHNPNGDIEDDGVLISTVIDNRQNTQDFLLFLDAKTMLEMGRAYFTEEIPTAVHGLFISDESGNSKDSNSNGSNKK